jgi:hypothetical protein
MTCIDRISGSFGSNNLKDLPKKENEDRKGEDSAFISEAADWLTPFRGSEKFKKFDKSLALVA